MYMSKDLEIKIEALIKKRDMETEALKKLLAAFEKKNKKKVSLEKKQ